MLPAITTTLSGTARANQDRLLSARSGACSTLSDSLGHAQETSSGRRTHLICEVTSICKATRTGEREQLSQRDLRQQRCRRMQARGLKRDPDSRRTSEIEKSSSGFASAAQANLLSANHGHLFCKNRGPLQYMRQFTDVARPVVQIKLLQRSRREGLAR